MKSPGWDLVDLPPYGLGGSEKLDLLLPRLRTLTSHHYQNGAIYRKIMDQVFGALDGADFRRLEDLPFLPVSLFKTHDLKSVPDSEVVKVLTSSGTTGQRVSRIFLDSDTARIQAAVLVKVAQHFLGKARLPMVVLDHPGVVHDRHSYSARAAGIQGMLQFGHRPFYALRDDMTLDEQGLREYLAGAEDKRIFLFGFTYIIWSHFVEVLERLDRPVDLSRATLIHSGGWKKLADLNIDAETFRDRLSTLTGIPSVINFYGMVEQVGGVYFENERHYLQAPIFSDVIVRDPVTLRPLPDGEIGLIQVLSCLPTSYPGHSLLTEDMGVIRGADAPESAMKGRYFEVIGRVPRSEVRGCSDTFQLARAT